MEKIIINLNPQKQKPDNPFLERGMPYAMLAAVGLSVVLFVGGIFLAIQTGMLVHYRLKWQKWADKFQVLDTIKKEIASLESERNEFKKIITPQNQIALILRDVFISLPKNIWFEQLIFKKNVLNFKGYVVKIGEDYLASLDKFIDALSEKKYFASKFSKVTIKSSQKKAYNGVEALEFIIECVN